MIRLCEQQKGAAKEQEGKPSVETGAEMNGDGQGTVGGMEENSLCIRETIQKHGENPSGQQTMTEAGEKKFPYGNHWVFKEGEEL